MRGLIKFSIVSGLSVIPHAALAQDITCSGEDPAWSLSTADQSATFQFERTSDMQVMQDDLAQNAPNVRAMTLVGPRDSAIVVLQLDQKRATILTQRGQTPIILAGTCD